MKKTNTSVVVTSIFHPTKALKEIAKGTQQNSWDFVIVGDVSSPADFNLEGADFYSIAQQEALDFSLASLCPKKHYTRKNIGYLITMSRGSEVIVETDDDNIPVASFWDTREAFVALDLLNDRSGWANVYDLFSDSNIWPRGLPLEYVANANDYTLAYGGDTMFSPIQQGLADENPDVDAVYRMTQSLPINFDKRERAIGLGKGAWCPFNSQNTTWFKEAFPLLYLPSFCTFRMTDIWRSFVAQRVAWECGWHIIFHNATVYQERNEHNLLHDFEQEVPGYLMNNQIKDLLENLSLRSGVEHIPHNMMLCYEELVRRNIINDKREIALLTAWLEDVSSLVSPKAKSDEVSGVG